MSNSPEREKEISQNISELRAGELNESVAGFLGMKLEELTPGYARVSMKLRPEFRNFNGFVFGGVIMSVADQAFAYASNTVSYPSLASQFNIHFIAGAEVDDTLIAECRVVKSGRRVGVSEITVTNSVGKLIARATGTTIPVDKKSV